MYLSSTELCAALAVPDLSDSSGDAPAGGVHALALLLDRIIEAATAPHALPHRMVRSSPLVATIDNYDTLGFDADAITRDRRYSRYVSPTVMLRSHMSAGIPALLRQLEADGDRDEVLVLPGLVFHRDQIDRTHVADPHQVDVWRVSAPTRRTVAELRDMVDALVSAVLPGARWREVPAAHPYTQEGRQIDVLLDGEWLELAECGLIDPALLARCGLDPERWSGLALGLGLDRALMLRKGIDDIRVLRSRDPRAVAQLRDLSPWRPISTLPPVTRDLSIVIDEDDDDETLCDTVRRALGADADDLESVAVVTRTPQSALPPAAQARLGIAPGQVNALLRIVLRPLQRTLTDAEANRVRDRVYLAVHRGRVLELIGEAGVP